MILLAAFIKYYYTLLLPFKDRFIWLHLHGLDCDRLDIMITKNPISTINHVIMRLCLQIKSRTRMETLLCTWRVLTDRTWWWMSWSKQALKSIRWMRRASRRCTSPLCPARGRSVSSCSSLTEPTSTARSVSPARKTLTSSQHVN